MWRTVVNGWERPTVVKDDKTFALKPESQWSVEENVDSEFNNKVLNTIMGIMGSLDESQFSLIIGCIQGKQSWDILEAIYEGDAGMKQSKLQHVHTKFEELKMREDEMIIQFNARIQKLKNEVAVLGDPFSENKLVHKILRSLPQRFRMKVNFIQESMGWELKTVAELMSNLQTYEKHMFTKTRPKTME